MSNKNHKTNFRLEDSLKTFKKKRRRLYEPLKKHLSGPQNCLQYHKNIFEDLRGFDSKVYELITREYDRIRDSIQLVAAENICSPAVLAALGSVIQNKTAEGFVADRLHSGCEVIDDVETLAVERAKEAFDAEYANVQPHSGTSANLIVISSILSKNDKILSLTSEQGGHFSHGSKDTITARLFDISNYYLDKRTFLLDYDSIEEIALKIRPRLIICGASVYSRQIDFARFRDIAEKSGAFLLADISHISALVAAGAHPSPIDYAHFTTTSTYKPGGPRGGLILMGRDFDLKIRVNGKQLPLWRLIERATFPGLQGTVHFNNVAAKAVFFKEMLSEEYKTRQFKVIENAKALAAALTALGHDVLTGGTDNHMVLVNPANSVKNMTASAARRCFEECGIIVDRIKLAYEPSGMPRSGLRLGTPIVTKMGMGHKEIEQIAVMMDKILRRMKISGRNRYFMDEALRKQVTEAVKDLCMRFAGW